MLVQISGNGGRSLGYDAIGNLARDQRSNKVLCFGYDGFNRLAVVYDSANPSATCSQSMLMAGWYKSNGLNQRARKLTAAGVTHYVHGPGGELLYETGPSGSTSYLWHAGALLGIDRAASIYVAHNDQVGRPEGLSNASGQVVWRSSNGPFDRTAASSSIGEMNLGFPGQYSTQNPGFGTTGIDTMMPVLGDIPSRIPLGSRAASTRMHMSAEIRSASSIPGD